MPTHAGPNALPRLTAGLWLGAAGAIVSGFAHVGIGLVTLTPTQGGLLALHLMAAGGTILSGAAMAIVLPLLRRIEREAGAPVPTQAALIRSMGLPSRCAFWIALLYVNGLLLAMVAGVVPMSFPALLSAFGVAAGTACALLCRQLARLVKV